MSLVRKKQYKKVPVEAFAEQCAQEYYSLLKSPSDVSSEPTQNLLHASLLALATPFAESYYDNVVREDDGDDDVVMSDKRTISLASVTSADMLKVVAWTSARVQRLRTVVRRNRAIAVVRIYPSLPAGAHAFELLFCCIG